MGKMKCCGCGTEEKVHKTPHNDYCARCMGLRESRAKSANLYSGIYPWLEGTGEEYEHSFGWKMGRAQKWYLGFGEGTYYEQENDVTG